MKFLSEEKIVERDLVDLEKDIRNSSGSDPDFDTNRKLKQHWTKKLQLILTNHFGVEEFK